MESLVYQDQQELLDKEVHLARGVRMVLGVKQASLDKEALMGHLELQEHLVNRENKGLLVLLD